MNKVKITVVKRMFNQELADRYSQPGNVPCELFAEGQEFIVESLAKPEGFCDWAWNDLYKGVVTLSFGGSFGCWMKEEKNIVLCCSDGIRPVAFSLEGVD